MIRKWLKLNKSFIELLVSSAVPKNPEPRWPLDKPWRNYSSCSLASSTEGSSITHASVPSALRFCSNFSSPSERGDGDFGDEEAGGEAAVLETPAKTELFEVSGPQGAAFLVEVHTKDLEDVRRDLVRLKGDFFHFDKAVINLFTMKCLLTAEPIEFCSLEDQVRLARVHAISSGCEEVFPVDGAQRFLFVNSIDRTLRAKQMLEKLGYKISGIMYKFQPKEKVDLDERFREVCHSFAGAVSRLPKVISVIHNL